MNDINPNVIKGLEHIRAAYPTNVYVGGSFARQYIMPEFGHYNDVDVFILGVRRSEVWVTFALMRSLFDHAENMIKYEEEECGLNGDGNPLYMLEHQHGRFVCTLGDTTFDIIFLDDTIDNLIINQTASSLSKFYLELTYNTQEMLHVVDHPESKTAIGDLKISKVCHLQSGKGTKQHIDKVERVCRNHGIRLHHVPQKPFDIMAALMNDGEVADE